MPPDWSTCSLRPPEFLGADPITMFRCTASYSVESAARFASSEALCPGRDRRAEADVVEHRSALLDRLQHHVRPRRAQLLALSDDRDNHRPHGAPADKVAGCLEDGVQKSGRGSDIRERALESAVDLPRVVGGVDARLRLSGGRGEREPRLPLQSFDELTSRLPDCREGWTAVIKKQRNLHGLGRHLDLSDSPHAPILLDAEVVRGQPGGRPAVAIQGGHIDGAATDLRRGRGRRNQQNDDDSDHDEEVQGTAGSGVGHDGKSSAV